MPPYQQLITVGGSLPLVLESLRGACTHRHAIDLPEPRRLRLKDIDEALLEPAQLLASQVGERGHLPGEEMAQVPSREVGVGFGLVGHVGNDPNP